jgi:PAS domain S-box-containing protein
MKEKPDIVKMLQEEEKLGILQGQFKINYNESELNTESIKDVSDKRVSFVENEKVKKIEDTHDDKSCIDSHEMEKKFRLITENTSDLIAITTFKMNPTYTYVSPSYKKILGYQPEEMVGKPSFDFVHPDDKKKLMPLLKKYVGMKIKNLLFKKDKDVTENFEFRIIDKSGNWHYLESTANIIEDELLFISKDITKRKKTEELIRENDKRYYDLFENANDLIQAVKPDGSLLYVNKIWKKTLGYNEQEISNINIFDIIRPEEKDHFIELFKHIMSGENIGNVKASFVTKDGQIISLEGNINCRFEDDKPVSIHGIFRDISEQERVINEIKNAKNKLELKNQELEKTIKYANRVSLETKNALTELDQIFNTSVNGMLVLDKDHHILKMNDTFSTLFGVNKAESIGKKCYDVLNEPSCHTNDCPLKKILDGVEHVEFETEIIHPNGTGIPCSLSASPFKKSDGKILGIIEDFKDITEWKKAEKNIKTAYEKLEKKVKELERYKKLTVDREMRMIELKKKLKEKSDQEEEL